MLYVYLIFAAVLKSVFSDFNASNARKSIERFIKNKEERSIITDN